MDDVNSFHFETAWLSLIFLSQILHFSQFSTIHKFNIFSKTNNFSLGLSNSFLSKVNAISVFKLLHGFALFIRA